MEFEKFFRGWHEFDCEPVQGGTLRFVRGQLRNTKGDQQEWRKGTQRK